MSKGLNFEQNYSFLFEILTLLGYYVAYVGSCFLMFRDSLWVPFSRVRQPLLLGAWKPEMLECLLDI
jgi:hypothetical protein